MTPHTENWQDRIQNYREHLELLCKHSKSEFCIGCGMTDRFFDVIVAQTKSDTLKLAIEVLEGMKVLCLGDPEMMLSLEDRFKNKTLSEAQEKLRNL